MPELALALVIGFLFAFFSVWLVSFINNRYTRREKFISSLLQRRAKKD
ncbi:MAG: hypothetical protein NTY64_04405 [Deltaproteobacteria bacterium]|nr:hypothetical protein [Deltaproteobacteria bacterium]